MILFRKNVCMNAKNIDDWEGNGNLWNNAINWI